MTTLLVDIDDSQQACWHYSAKILISVVLYSHFPTRPVQRSLPSKKIDQHQHANSSIAPSIQIRWSLCIFHSVSLRFILKASQNRAEWLNDNDSLPSSILIFFPDCKKNHARCVGKTPGTMEPVRAVSVQQLSGETIKVMVATRLICTAGIVILCCKWTIFGIEGEGIQLRIWNEVFSWNSWSECTCFT